MARDSKFLVINNLTGGLATRPNPLIAEGSQIKRMQSPNMRNVDLFNLGSVSKRLGKTQQGSDITNSVWASQTTHDVTQSLTDSGSGVAICQKITASASVAVQKIQVYSGSLSGSVSVSIRTNSAGNPGTVVTNATTTAQTCTGNVMEFEFATAPNITSGTAYWICLNFTGASSYTANGTGNGSSGNVKYTQNAFSTFTTSTLDNLYYQMLVVVNSQLTSNSFDTHTVTTWAGSFVAGASVDAYSITIKTSSPPSITGNVRARIYTDSGGSPGSAISGATIAYVTNAATVTIPLSSGTWTLTSGTTYWVVVEYTVAQKVSGSGTTTTGRVKYYTGSAWASAKMDDLYYVINYSLASQLSSNLSQTVSDSGAVPAFCQKIVAGSSVTISSLTFWNNSTANSVYATIRADSGGSPGAVLTNGTSQTTTNAAGLTTLVFPVPPSVTNGVTYWFCINYTGYTGTVSYSIYGTGSGSSGNVKTTVDGFLTFSTSTFNNLYYSIAAISAASSVNGLFDYRYGSASTQKVVATANGNIYYNNAGTWTSIQTGLATGQDNLYAFASLKDYLFSLDNATNPGRVWNGSASYTTKLGFQATYALADNATAATVPNGVYQVMAVTTLASGGYRASAPVSITVTGGGTHRIRVSSIVADGTSSSNFGFDIAATATKWFMTDAAGTVYYKIPSGNMTVANPMPNNTTTFDITATTSLTAANTLLDEYGLEQAYFTTQIASPTGAYFGVFNNMLAMAGDASYPSRVWFSGIADGTNLAGPQIWSTNGGLYGNYRDLEPNDGEVIVGLKEWNGNLYVFKRHSVFLVSFTGVDTNPFESRRLSGNLGALSHWSIKETPRGLAFISERGPAICTGTTIDLIPGAQSILNKFDLNDTECYNLAVMRYTTAGNNSTKMQIQWGVSSHSATTRDITLVYDYEKGCFWENDISANYYTEVTDSNFFPAVWSGNYSSQIFRHDYGTNDAGATISFYFETPNISFGEPFTFKTMDHLFISGAVQTSGTLNLDIYTDMSDTATTSRTISMSDPRFVKGMMVPLNLTCTYLRVKISNSELDVPVQINDIGVGWQEKGLRV